MKLQMFGESNMNIQRGQRGKLDMQFNLDTLIKIKMQVNGTAVYDYCCFGVDESNHLSDDRYMVFYNQMQSPQKEITYHMTGISAEFDAILSRLPETIQKLVFTVSIDGSGTMGQLSDFEVSVSQNGSEPIVLQLTGNDFSQEKAIIAFEIYHKNGWKYAAVARGFNGGLGELLRSYGGEEANDAQKNQMDSAEQSAAQQVLPVQQTTLVDATVQQAVSSSPPESEILKLGSHPVNLKKNQKVELRKPNNETLKKVIVGLGWDAKKIGFNIDCDASVILCQNGKFCSNNDIVAFYNKKHSSGAVIHQGDNLTGEGAGDDERIIIDLTKMPANYDRIIIVVNIFMSVIKRQHFGKIKNCYMRICEQKGKELCRYTLSENPEYDKKSAMIFGELIKQNDSWIFHAIGQGTSDHSISGLASHFK